MTCSSYVCICTMRSGHPLSHLPRTRIHLTVQNRFFKLTLTILPRKSISSPCVFEKLLRSIRPPGMRVFEFVQFPNITHNDVWDGIHREVENRYENATYAHVLSLIWNVELGACHRRRRLALGSQRAHIWRCCHRPLGVDALTLLLFGAFVLQFILWMGGQCGQAHTTSTPGGPKNDLLSLRPSNYESVRSPESHAKQSRS